MFRKQSNFLTVLGWGKYYDVQYVIHGFGESINDFDVEIEKVYLNPNGKRDVTKKLSPDELNDIVDRIFDYEIDCQYE